MGAAAALRKLFFRRTAEQQLEARSPCRQAGLAGDMSPTSLCPPRRPPSSGAGAVWVLEGHEARGVHWGGGALGSPTSPSPSPKIRPAPAYPQVPCG